MSSEEHHAHREGSRVSSQITHRLTEQEKHLSASIEYPALLGR